MWWRWWKNRADAACIFHILLTYPGLYRAGNYGIISVSGHKACLPEEDRRAVFGGGVSLFSSFAGGGELSSVCLRRVTFFLWRKKGAFRAPARVTFGRSPKSDQKGCLKPKVSRLPARYALRLLAVCTTRSRGFDFVVRSKGSSLRLHRCR